MAGISSFATSASIAPAATNAPLCSSNLYAIPTNDAACAMPYGGNHTSIMTSCCKGASVVSYYNDCGLYCLAQGQDVAELTSCLYAGGAAWQDVFCTGATTATATGSGMGTLATSAGASVVKAAAASGTSGAATLTSGASGLVTPTSSSQKSDASRKQIRGAKSRLVSWTSGCLLVAMFSSMYVYNV